MGQILDKIFWQIRHTLSNHTPTKKANNLEKSNNLTCKIGKI